MLDSPHAGSPSGPDGVLLLLDEEALYKKALELAACGAGLERSLAVLARGMRTLEEAVRSLAVRTLEEEALSPLGGRGSRGA